MTEDIRFYADPDEAYFPLSLWFPKPVSVDGKSYKTMQHYIYENLLAFDSHRQTLQDYQQPIDFARVFDVLSEKEFFILGNQAIKNWYKSILGRINEEDTFLRRIMAAEDAERLQLDPDAYYVYQFDAKNPSPFDYLLGVDANQFGFNCAGEVLMEIRGDRTKRHNIIVKSFLEDEKELDANELEKWSKYAVAVSYIAARALLYRMHMGIDINDPQIMGHSPHHILIYLGLEQDISKHDHTHIFREYSECDPMTHPIFYFVEMERRYPFHMAQFIRQQECRFLNTTIFSIVATNVYEYIALSAIDRSQKNRSDDDPEIMKYRFTLSSAKSLAHTKLASLTERERVALFSDLFFSYRNGRLRLPEVLQDGLSDVMKSYIDSPEDIHKAVHFVPRLYYETDDGYTTMMGKAPQIKQNIQIGDYMFETMYDYVGFFIVAKMTRSSRFAYDYMIRKKESKDIYTQYKNTLSVFKKHLVEKVMKERYKDIFFGLVLSSTLNRSLVYMDPFDQEVGVQGNLVGHVLERIRKKLSPEFKEQYTHLQPLVGDFPFLHEWVSSRFHDVINTLRIVSTSIGSTLNQKQVRFFMEVMYDPFFKISRTTIKSSPTIDAIIEYYSTRCKPYVASDKEARYAMTIVGSCLKYLIHTCGEDPYKMQAWIVEKNKTAQLVHNESSFAKMFVRLIRAFPKQERRQHLSTVYRCLVQTDDVVEIPKTTFFQFSSQYMYKTNGVNTPELNLLIPRVFKGDNEAIGELYFFMNRAFSNCSASRRAFVSV